MDTSKEADRVQVQAFRRMAPEARLQKALQLMELARELLELGVKQRHPDYTDTGVRLAAIRQQLPEALFRKVYPAVIGVEP